MHSKLSSRLNKAILKCKQEGMFFDLDYGGIVNDLLFPDGQGNLVSADIAFYDRNTSIPYFVNTHYCIDTLTESLCLD